MRGVTDDKHYINIAETIREKTGTENTYFPEEMPAGVGEVFEAGKQEGVDETKLAIWNALTAYGAREHFTRAFYEGDFTDFTFPKPIKVKGSAGRMFYNYRGTKLPRKEDIDLSGADVSYTGNDDIYGVNNAFGWASKVTFIPDYGIPAPAKYYLTYANIGKVIEIEKIRSKETTVWERTFENARSLTTLQIEGVIGTSFPIQYSPLSVASLKSIIKHLKDYTGTNEYSYTVTFKATAFAELEAEGATSPNGNTWAEYIDDLKWNLVKA